VAGDVTSAFQLIISRKALWEVLCALEDGRIKVKLQRKFLALYSGTNIGYYLLADGTTMAADADVKVAHSRRGGKKPPHGLKTTGGRRGRG
jgi:hypothetical protein